MILKCEAVACESEWDRLSQEIRATDERIDRRVRARVAKPGPRCRHRSRGEGCHLPEGHGGHHLIIEGENFMWWASQHSDPPTYYDRLIDSDL